MKLSVGTNFDARLPILLKDSHVDVFYGKLSSDLVGGGRPTFALPTIDRARVEEHVKLLHAYGFKFNYLLNATCLDNLETTKDFHYRLRELLEWIGTLQPEYVTVSLPMLIDMVRTALPDVKISLSTFANVNTLRQAQYFEEKASARLPCPRAGTVTSPSWRACARIPAATISSLRPMTVCWIARCAIIMRIFRATPRSATM